MVQTSNKTIPGSKQRDNKTIVINDSSLHKDILGES